MKCPYCSATVTTSSSSEDVECSKCSRRFKVVLTDHNDHSPHELSERLPYTVSRMGELFEVVVRDDQRFCSVCGSFYEKKDGACLELVSSIKRWYKNPKPIAERSEGLSESEVKEEIKVFLSKNFKRKKIEEMIGT